MPADGALDIEKSAQLLLHLRATGRIGADETIEVRLLHGGVSNRTVWVRRPSGETWVLKQALPKLRVQADWFSDPARVRREALGLRWLERLVPAGSVPGFVFLDEPHQLLAMQAVPEPHANWKTMLLSGQIDADFITQFARLLGGIHRKSWELRAALATAFDDRSFFESLRLEPYYLFTAEQVPTAADFLRSLADDTRQIRVALVHGDFSPKNILVRDRRLILVDHEVIHWGDPAFDLGFALTHLLSKAHHVAPRRTAFAQAAGQFWTEYGREIGPVPWRAALDGRVVRHTLACLLARVAGRSPLEYLDSHARQRQLEVVLRLCPAGLLAPPHLISEFMACLSSNA